MAACFLYPLVDEFILAVILAVLGLINIVMKNMFELFI